MSSTQDKSRKFELVSASPGIRQYKLPTKLIKCQVHKVKVENPTFICFSQNSVTLITNQVIKVSSPDDKSRKK